MAEIVYIDNGASGDDTDGFSSGEDEAYDLEPELTLDSIGRSHTINFSIRSNYTDWEPREAFRELVQNWRDGIIASFNIAERDFQVMRGEKSTGRNSEIVYKAYRKNAEPKEWLGYIRFKGRDGEGSIDITNRQGTLQPWHLDLGGTTKAGSEQQAGAHGEGLKIALLVLMRGDQNHKIRCRSGGFNWNFNFTNRGKLVARLRRMSPESIRKAEDQAGRLCGGSLLPFAAAPHRDVQFVIGEKSAGRDDWGQPIRRDLVKKTDFEDWTKAALFLQDVEDGGIAVTSRGDLITDPRLRGNIYLKGLLLQESTGWDSASITKKPLKFGYNFSSGATNRERQSVAGAKEESRAILAIWNQVLTVKPQLIEDLSDMLNSPDPEYADVSMAEKYMKIETACRLKEFLTSERFAGKWYYTDMERSDNSRLDHVIQGLGCEGVKLTKAYWRILRGYKLARTAEEEEQRRFLAAEAAPVLQTTFAKSVNRLLRACMRACHQTDGMAVQFVKAGQLRLQLFCAEAGNLLKIHERWLTRDGATEELGLTRDLLDSDIAYHTVKRLFGEALEQVPSEKFEADEARPASWHRKLEMSRAEQRLLNYLRIEKVTVTVGYSRSLSVQWASGSGWACDTPVEIQIHRASSCFHLRDLLVAADACSQVLPCLASHVTSHDAQTGEGSVRADVSCRIHTIPIGRGTLWEHDLQEGQDYFFVLAVPSDLGSFVVVSEIARPAAPPSKLPSPAPTHPTVRRESSAKGGSGRAATAVSSPSAARNHGPELEHGPNTHHRPVNGGGDSPSPPPAPNNQRQPLAKTANPAPPAREISVVAELPGSPGTARNNDADRSPRGSFFLGDQLKSLDLFKIENRWYEATGTGNVKAVIGILDGEPRSETARKRRRVNWD